MSCRETEALYHKLYIQLFLITLPLNKCHWECDGLSGRVSVSALKGPGFVSHL